jgi:hypothetical protein
VSNDALFLSTIQTLDAFFGTLDLPAIEAAQPEDSPLAHPERTTLTLSNGDVIDVDLYQISVDCWNAKNANHDRQCGWDTTREKALKDLLQLCEDDLETCHEHGG